MSKPAILIWIVTAEHRQGWLCDGDALRWDIGKARTFDSLEAARLWLARNDLAGTIMIAVN